MRKQIYIALFLMLVVYSGWFAASAFTQSTTCTVTGVLLGGDNLPKAGVRLTVTPLLANGVLMSSGSFQTGFSDAAGAISFTVRQGARYNIKGNALQYTGSGLNVTIPASTTSTLEALQATSTIPTEGLTLKSNNVAFGNFFGTLDFSSAFTLTESPTGEMNIDITGAGITSLNSLTGASQTLVAGSAGSDFAISSSGTTHTFNLPTASATKRGLLSTSDWAAFNAKLSQASADLLYAAIGHNHSGIYEPVLGFTAVPTTRTVNGHALSANVTVTPADLSLVIGTNVQAYNAGLGQIAALADPNADRLLFWDDSAGAYTFLTLGTNLSITGTTLDAAGGGGGGATAALDNLASVAINTDLLPASTQGLGSAAKPFLASYFGTTTQYEAVSQSADLITHAALGSASNIGIMLSPKGNGYVTIDNGRMRVGAGGNNGQLFIQDSGNDRILIGGGDGNGAFMFQSANSSLKWNGGATYFASTPDLEIGRAGVALMKLTDNNYSGGGLKGAGIQFVEMTAPGTPGSNKVNLYAEDNGSGKTRIVAKFDDGSTVVVALQP